MSTDGDLDDRIRAQRPRPGWTTGAEGVRTWDAVRSAQGRVRESATRRTWLLAAAAAVVLVCATTLAVRVLGPTADVAAPRPTNGRVAIIDQGLTYDADDLRAVMTNTDTVFVARVLEVIDRDEDAAWTAFTVSLLETIAGQPPAEPRVRQHGYVDRQGTLHIIENQSLVEIDGTYIFATNVEPSLDVYTVAPGPYAARPTVPEGQRTLVQQYRDAR